jgi:hypothetical protein
MEELRKPAQGEFPAFYGTYIAEAQGDTLGEALRRSSEAMHAIIAELSARGDHRYAPGKWSVKEVLLHVVDSERIFAYRALRFARKDATPLPGYDENEYAPASGADGRSLASLLKEHDAVRAATATLFEGFTAEMVARSGTANNDRISVSSIGWTIAGHAEHHVRILRERYLSLP